MKKSLPIHDALVNIMSNKSHDFLYNVKKVNTDSDKLWLPRVSKKAIADIIKSEGLYKISYKLYTNESGYESIFICSAERVVTK